MTKLAERKTRLSFVTDAEMRYRGKMRAVVIEIDSPHTATARLQGTRVRYPFSWEGVFVQAADRFAKMERERRKLERKARGGR